MGKDEQMMGLSSGEAIALGGAVVVLPLVTVLLILAFRHDVAQRADRLMQSFPECADQQEIGPVQVGMLRMRVQQDIVELQQQGGWVPFRQRRILRLIDTLRVIDQHEPTARDVGADHPWVQRANRTLRTPEQ